MLIRVAWWCSARLGGRFGRRLVRPVGFCVVLSGGVRFQNVCKHAPTRPGGWPTLAGGWSGPTMPLTLADEMSTEPVQSGRGENLELPVEELLRRARPLPPHQEMLIDDLTEEEGAAFLETLEA
jgi:hypothetical protein